MFDMEAGIAKVFSNNQIDSTLYGRFEVKRGLRNRDGSGVLVGLTQIGDVHGYIQSEHELVPVEGELRYRGISVIEITKFLNEEGRQGFEEVVYLLMFGELPSKAELVDFKEYLSKSYILPDGFTENMILKSPSNNIMNLLARATLALYSYDPLSEDISIPNVVRQCLNLVASYPAMIAYGYQAKRHYHAGKSLIIRKPMAELGIAENFLRMIRPRGDFSKLEADMLDTMLIIHAEHGGGNNSAFTTHVVSSSDTDTYSVMAAAVGSLKGPKHGGANAKVAEMLNFLKEEVKEWSSETQIKDALAAIMRKETFDKTGLIYGMGHAVYTLSDPRVAILKDKAVQLAAEKGRSEEYEFFCAIERLAPFVFAEVKNSKKPLCANVDFYTGFVYEMLDIPSELNTSLFAMGRIAGWSAHRIEEIINGGRIIRPAYKNVSPRTHYIPFSHR